MAVKAAGCVFWAFFLVLFPVAVQQNCSAGCVTYKHRAICGLKGSSVQFSCCYPKNQKEISMSGWSGRSHPDIKPKPLEQMPAYMFRMKYHERGNNDCTMKLTDLQQSDTSIYYFTYIFQNVTGYHMTCNGLPGVRLRIFASPVSILVEKLVSGQGVRVADRTVIEGQRIRLTCVPTCAANLNSNPGYIWYKNRVQLNGSRTNSRFLSLDPVSYEDTGSYVCVLIGYKDLPSSAVNLTVQGRPRDTVSDKVPDGGSKMDSVPTLTHGCDAHSSTEQIFNNCQKPKSLFIFSLMLSASVYVGLVITIMVAIVLKVKKTKEEEKKKQKKKKKKKSCADSVPRPPSPNSDFYMVLDIHSMSAEYDTLEKMRRCSAADTVYENLCQPGKTVG